ncbi:similar to Saccharomyces cerevisiae YDR073W SNF11 Subunit of the SWI/SNF chromatin remodeling complex involved in transcriptional regulation [Maudiozyma barnettii]|uniref:Similar to Saccharomyces cerevisiae YDR073W SNF11 Subunit of the SWI/SNF chromatin remodeling complex involved in transcriptional regulation n=1 Tax=Maudiozyma barnettii TaxID=61262 RepID=A0A8H2VJI9_9SACH|nr:Snf11p [Kazachstania barnettii]CAB4256581.1 similar to Saccharomyces cerevisiae YDR073W SNF11 Subunit of the SWI/SNF chromatin remodeling complex involved in transcriptional regulation [Kazachstania barnettii]CAD1785184.1 similar to Saccharomyces cerevisiae YDR073W SNF11 Subunit of the SWI/SNF chromatin remodeling complex involved in transcriptional regulation [Kazachstania barnettii]
MSSITTPAAINPGLPHNNINNNNRANDVLQLDPNQIISVDEQIQYKIQLLLHINSVLLARVIHMTNPFFKDKKIEANSPSVLPENIQSLVSQNLKRVHANLQCISQINQGFIRSKPVITVAPVIPQQQQQQPNNDILAKLYLLMSRVFEFW